MLKEIRIRIKAYSFRLWCCGFKVSLQSIYTCLWIIATCMPTNHSGETLRRFLGLLLCSATSCPVLLSGTQLQAAMTTPSSDLCFIHLMGSLLPIRALFFGGWFGKRSGQEASVNLQLTLLYWAYYVQVSKCQQVQLAAAWKCWMSEQIQWDTHWISV